MAPQTTIVHRQHQHQHQSEPGALAPARHSLPAGAGRKPTRVTLVPKRDPPPQPVAGAGPGELGEPAAQAAPLFASQLPAVQLKPTFSPLAPTEPAAQQLARQASGAGGPALASFRATGTSVSARHSALMAQVAAERAAAGALLGEPGAPSQPQPSLGSPLEALSSPAAAQVQAPAQPAPTGLAAVFASQPDEPMAAPSFENVLSRGCPHKGVFSYENKDHCDRYYMCTNGTFTEEACPNGLAYSQLGAVYQHCAYNWNVDCGRKKTPEPIASPGCPWQFGIFPIAAGGQCSIDYFVCEWGVPETKRCSPEGLFYDDRIKGCQWADQLGCKSEALLNFKCPAEDEDNPYWPYPRYYHTNRDVIVCVNEQPRLVHCTDDQLVDPSSLACVDVKKKKKKF